MLFRSSYLFAPVGVSALNGIARDMCGSWIVVRDAEGLLSSSEDTGPDDRERCIHPLHPPLLPSSSHLPHSPRFFFLSFPAHAHTCTRIRTASQANCCFAQKKKKRDVACSLLCDCLSFGFGFGLSLFFYTIRFSATPRPRSPTQKAKGSRRGEVAGTPG